MVACSLYGVSVSWPYLHLARGGGTKAKTLINLLETTDLHRCIAPFCRNIAANPTILLDPSMPLAEVTIDGQEFMDPMLIESIHHIAADLLDLNCAISATFAGAATGWDNFTTKFVEGRPFDQLTPAEKALLFIPSTNHANEGALGSLQTYKKSRPNATADSFSDRACVECNETENYIFIF